MLTVGTEVHPCLLLPMAWRRKQRGTRGVEGTWVAGCCMSRVSPKLSGAESAISCRGKINDFLEKNVFVLYLKYKTPLKQLQVTVL